MLWYKNCWYVCEKKINLASRVRKGHALAPILLSRSLGPYVTPQAPCAGCMPCRHAECHRYVRLREKVIWTNPKEKQLFSGRSPEKKCFLLDFVQVTSHLLTVRAEGADPPSRFPCCVLSYFSLVFVMEHWQIQVIRVSWVGQSTRRRGEWV